MTKAEEDKMENCYNTPRTYEDYQASIYGKQRVTSYSKYKSANKENRSNGPVGATVLVTGVPPGGALPNGDLGPIISSYAEEA